MSYPEDQMRRGRRGSVIFADDSAGVDEEFIADAVQQYLKQASHANELEPDAVTVMAYKTLVGKGHGRRVAATMSVELQTAMRNALKTAVKRVSANVLHEENKEERR